MCLKNNHKKFLDKWINLLTNWIPENTAKIGAIWDRFLKSKKGNRNRITTTKIRLG